MLDAEDIDRHRLASWGDGHFGPDRPVLFAAYDNFAGHQVERLSGFVDDHQLVYLVPGLLIGPKVFLSLLRDAFAGFDSA